jgi:cytoskeletal protein RodZ
MGLRFRRSVSLGKGVRLNFGKKGTSVSFGGRGAHVTYSTTGRKTTSVGIPGTGISYVKSEKIGGKKNSGGSVPPTPPESNNLLGSNPPPQKKGHGCGLFAGILAIIIIISAAVNSCSGGRASSSSQASSANSAVVSSSVSSDEVSSEEVSSEAASSKASEAPPSAVPKAAASSKLTLVDAPGTVTNGSNASLTIKGKPNTQYSIAVYYSAGKSSAQGLESKASGSDGSVSWTWKVGAKTKAGTHRIVISGGGDQIETSITTEK